MVYNCVEGRFISSKVLRLEFRIKVFLWMILRSCFFSFLIESIHCVSSLELSSKTSYLEHCKVKEEERTASK